VILLIGTLSDSVMGVLCDRLLARAEPFVLLDPRTMADGFELDWWAEDGRVDARLEWGTQVLSLSDLRSAYVHDLTGPMALHPIISGSRPEPLTTVAALTAFTNSAPILVVPRPYRGMSNSSKPFQLQLIEKSGLKVPRTLVTNRPEEVVRFYEACDGRVIFKSISHLRSVVKRLTPGYLDQIDRVRHCPTQFQEYIPGVDVRVHVIGERLFATEVWSEQTDYRYDHREIGSPEMRPAQLPAEIEERCLSVTRQMGSVLAGIDLRRTPGGDHYCFEVNPTPGFTFYEANTGQKMSEALVELLCSGKGNDARRA